jgi:hypothetical protein
VSGAVARTLEYHQARTPDETFAALRGQASVDQIGDVRGAPNRLLYLPPPVAPSAPTEVVWSKNDVDHTVTARWKPPVSEGSAPVISYAIYYAQEGYGSSALPTARGVAAPASSLTVDVTPGINTGFRLYAYSKAGTGQGVSQEFDMAPAIPYSVHEITAEKSEASRSVTVTWSDPYLGPYNEASSYRITRDGADAAGVGPTSVVVPSTSPYSATFTNLKPGSTYTFSVSGMNVSGTGPARSTTVTMAPVAPTAATGVAATKVDTTGTATLTWQPPTSSGGSPVTGYRVSRDGVDDRGNGAYTAVVTADKRSQSFVWLKPLTTYTLSVQPITAAGPGPATSVKVAMGATLPAAATVVAATKDDPAKTATLTWQAPTSTGGSPITGYRVSRDGVDNRGNGAYTAVVTADKRSQSFVWLAAGSSYNLTVQPLTAVGAGPATTVKVTMKADAPTAATAVAASKNDAARTATLTWQPPSSTGGSAVTGYRVSRDGIDSAGAGPLTTTVTATARSHSFGNLRPGIVYTLTVQPVNAVGAGTATPVKVTMAALPSAPTAVTATKSYATKTVTLAWQPPTSTGGSAVTGYRVTRDGTNSLGVGPTTVTAAATARSQAFSSLRAGTTYTFTVQAITAAGTGPAATLRVAMTA